MIYAIVLSLIFILLIERRRRADLEETVLDLQSEKYSTVPLNFFLDAAERQINTAYKSEDHKRKLRRFLRDVKDQHNIIHVPPSSSLPHTTP